MHFPSSKALYNLQAIVLRILQQMIQQIYSIKIAFDKKNNILSAYLVYYIINLVQGKEMLTKSKANKNTLSLSKSNNNK